MGIRQRHAVCSECREDFVMEEIEWAHDCNGKAASGCHTRRGIWYGPDGMVRLEMPEMKWTNAMCPGADPLCDECVAGKCGN